MNAEETLPSGKKIAEDGTVEVTLDDPLLWLELSIEGASRYRSFVLRMADLIEEQQRELDIAIAVPVDPPEMQDDITDFLWSDYASLREDAIGVCCVSAQTRISAVISAALPIFYSGHERSQRPGKEASRHLSPSIKKFRMVEFLGPDFSFLGSSFVDLIWNLANYYKHRDEWGEAVWNDPNLKDQSVDTRKAVQQLGVQQFSRTNMADALSKLGINKPDDYKKLADELRRWSLRMLELARRRPK